MPDGKSDHGPYTTESFQRKTLNLNAFHRHKAISSGISMSSVADEFRIDRLMASPYCLDSEFEIRTANRNQTKIVSNAKLRPSQFRSDGFEASNRPSIAKHSLGNFSISNWKQV